MRRGIENLGRSLALFLAGAIGSNTPAQGQENRPRVENKSAAPGQFTRENLPVVLDTDLKKLSPEERAHVMAAALRELELMLPAHPDNAKFIGALEQAPRPELDLRIFESARLSGNLIRAKLLRPEAHGGFLNAQQIESLRHQHQVLEQAGYVAAPFEHLQAWVNELGQNRAGQEQLYQYYQTLRAILKNEPVDVPAPAEMPAPRMPALRTPEMEPAAPTPAANPVEARHKELRPAKPRADKMFHYAEVDRTESGKPIYYLTFDDGPRPDETRRILKVLAEKKVHATFFVLGENVKKYANTGILQEIAAGGHEICLHSYKHDEFIKLAKTTPVEQLYHDNVEVVNELLAQNNIPRSRIFRAPYGAMTKPQLKYFADRGIYVVHWSEVADEYKLTKAPQIIEMMTSSAKAGSIGLLHDVGVDSAQTAAAAPKVIDKLKAKKFAFGTMSQALGLRAFDEATTEAPTQAPVLPKDLKQPFEPEINQRAPAPAEPNVTLASVQNPTVERVDPFARAKASAKQEAPTSAPMPDKNPAPEAAEQLPKHYFAKTSMGTYVGWNVPRKEAYRYFEPGKQPKSNDLSAPFEGKNIDGSKSMVRLRAETFKAFIALKAEFDKTASAEARAIGLIVNEGFRTPEDQEKLLKKFGHTAAEDGVSTHQVGTGIDVYEGVTEEIYNALFEPQKCLKDPNYKPLAVRHGFVLMYPGESWHIEFAPGNMPNGKAIADAFWEQYGQKILKFQTKRLQSHAQRERERTQAKK